MITFTNIENTKEGERERERHVVYFDQCLGDAHSKGSSKSNFSTFHCTKKLKKEEKA